MADIFMGDYNIEYSVVDGRVRRFTSKDNVFFDEDREINIPGWKERIVELLGAEKLDFHGIALDAIKK